MGRRPPVEPTEMLGVRIPVRMKDQLAKKAAKNHRNLSEETVVAIEQYLVSGKREATTHDA